MGFFDLLKNMFTGGFNAATHYKDTYGVRDGENVIGGGTGLAVGDEVTKTEAAVAIAASLLTSSFVYATNTQQVSYVITDQGRLIFGLFGGQPSPTTTFEKNPETKVVDTGTFLKEAGGTSDKDYTMMGPKMALERVRVIKIEGQGPTFTVGVVESLVPGLVNWAGG